MSKYFQVLERLERGRTRPMAPRIGDAPSQPEAATERGIRHAVPRPPRAAVKPVVEPATRPEPAAAVPPDAPPASEAPAEARPRPALKIEPIEFPPPPGVPEGVDAVFHNIDALTLGRRPVTLVFAGASSTPAVRAFANGLAAYAEAKGESIAIAELIDVAGQRRLVCHHGVDAPEATDSSEPTDPPGVPFALSGGATRETLAEWRRQAVGGAGLVFVIGPALADSMDSALLASLCDGLVVVVVHEQTHRASLTAASERARLAKCPTLAVLVNHGRNKTPSWLRRIVAQ